MSKLPSLYLNSKLFHRPVRDVRDNSRDDPEKYKKGAEIPDPQKESLHPVGDENPRSPTSKALQMLKTALKPKQPDTSGKLEGKFTVSCQEMITQLNKIVSAEYSQWMRYHHYALVLRGHNRDVLADEFKEHAGQELGHAERVAMRVVGLGGYPSTEMVHPSALTEAEDILKELLFWEQEGMKLYRSVHALCGANEGTRQVLEANIENEQEHVDELWRYLQNPEMIKAGATQESGQSRMPRSEATSNREHDHSFDRVPMGISGGQTPDLPERGRDWHGTVPGVPDEPQDGGDDDDNLDKPPENLVEPITEAAKSLLTSFNDPAMKALSGAPIFSPGPFVPPPEREWMIRHGYNENEVDSGKVRMSSRQRAEFNRWLNSTVQKSISDLGRLT